MMKYVVAFFSDHTGELLQEIVEAPSKLDAANSYLDTNFSDMADVYQYCANTDSTIHLLKLSQPTKLVPFPSGPLQAALYQ